jgi:hypothetical protein
MFLLRVTQQIQTEFFRQTRMLNIEEVEEDVYQIMDTNFNQTSHVKASLKQKMDLVEGRKCCLVIEM